MHREAAIVIGFLYIGGFYDVDTLFLHIEFNKSFVLAFLVGYPLSFFLNYKIKNPFY
jgi:hypothetical protein